MVRQLFPGAMCEGLKQISDRKVIVLSRNPNPWPGQAWPNLFSCAGDLEIKRLTGTRNCSPKSGNKCSHTHTHTLIEGRKNPLHECQGKASKGKKKPATNPGSLPIHQKREEEGVPGDSVTLHLLPRGGWARNCAHQLGWRVVASRQKCLKRGSKSPLQSVAPRQPHQQQQVQQWFFLQTQLRQVSWWMTVRKTKATAPL